MRLRKEPPYADEEIELARRQIAEIQEQVETLYLYIKHDDRGRAPEMVLRLQMSD
jgi:uncharacterized protein YecE (DUF72 family)